MADEKLAALTELTALAAIDLLYAVDVSDTTDDPTGTSKKVQAKNLNVYFTITAKEVAAGVTPTNLLFPPGDVRRYGATGDGVTLDTISLQNALNAGHRVWIPDGTYITGELLVPDNAVIEFESYAAILKLSTTAPAGDNILTNASHTGGGSNITVIGGKTDGNRIARAALSTAGGAAEDNNISMVKVARLRINGHFATSATRHGITTDGNGTPANANDYLEGQVSSDVKVTNCFATDCGDDGITMHHTDVLLVTGNICWDMAATLANNSNGIEIEDGCRQVTVTDNFCFNINEYDQTVAAARVRSDVAGSFMRRGIDVSASTSQPSPQNIKITDNHVWQVWKGIDCRRDGDTSLGTPKNLEICNNTVRDCQSTPIRVISYIGYLINDNIVDGEQSNALDTSDGILVTGDAGDGEISDNRVTNMPTLSRGIAVRTGAGVTHVITGNRVKNAGATTGIVAQVVTDIMITNNRVTGVAGSTSGIGAANATSVLITGNKIDGSFDDAISNPTGGSDFTIKDNFDVAETVTGTANANRAILTTAIDSSGGAVDLDLQDGLFDGQRKKITMSNASNSSTLSVTSHETSSPEIFTFAQITDSLTLEWDAANAFWWTVKNIGVAV